ncbi:unnamed protein product, partial [Rotaria sp. Silwood1]
MTSDLVGKETAVDAVTGGTTAIGALNGLV